MLLAILLGARDGVANAPAKVDVVVFKQNHVEQSDTMIHAPAYLHRLFLEHAHARCGFSGVQHACLCASLNQGLLVAVRHGGDATHALQDVQHQSLGLQKALLASFYRQHNVARVDVRTIGYVYLDLQVGIKTMEHLLGNVCASQYSFLFDE